MSSRARRQAERRRRQREELRTRRYASAGATLHQGDAAKGEHEQAENERAPVPACLCPPMPEARAIGRDAPALAS